MPAVRTGLCSELAPTGHNIRDMLPPASERTKTTRRINVLTIDSLHHWLAYEKKRVEKEKI